MDNDSTDTEARRSLAKGADWSGDSAAVNESGITSRLTHG